MSDFLSRLAGRSMGLTPIVEPVIPAMLALAFARHDQPEGAAGFGEVTEEREADPSPSPRMSGPRFQRAHDTNRADAYPAPPSQIARAAESSVPATREATIPSLVSQIERLSPPDSAAPPELTLPRWDRETPRALEAASSSRAQARQDRPSSARTADPPPIHVTIGRVEVRAEFPAPQSRPAGAPQKSSALSLDDYLKQRGEGRR